MDTNLQNGNPSEELEGKKMRKPSCAERLPPAPMSPKILGFGKSAASCLETATLDLGLLQAI